MMEFNHNISDGADKLMSQRCQKELIKKGESSDKHTNTSDGSFGSFPSLYRDSGLGCCVAAAPKGICVWPQKGESHGKGFICARQDWAKALWHGWRTARESSSLWITLWIKWLLSPYLLQAGSIHCRGIRPGVSCSASGGSQLHRDLGKKEEIQGFASKSKDFFFFFF